MNALEIYRLRQHLAWLIADTGQRWDAPGMLIHYMAKGFYHATQADAFDAANGGTFASLAAFYFDLAQECRITRWVDFGEGAPCDVK